MLSMYRRCPNCKLIIKDPNRELTNFSTPSPCCGHKGESREIWPSLDAKILSDIIEEQNLENYKEQKVAIVFICTYLERLLEEVITSHMINHVKTIEALDSLLDGYQGRQKRVGLLQKLFGVKIKEVSKQIGQESFAKDWEAIANLRNKVVHKGFYGHVEGFDKKEINLLVKSLLENSIPLFVEINNKIITKFSK
jgi:uncharacterized protein with HEPN domain